MKRPVHQFVSFRIRRSVEEGGGLAGRQVLTEQTKRCPIALASGEFVDPGIPRSRISVVR